MGLKIHFYLLIIVFSTGCALQMPVSVGLVFKNKDEKLRYEDQPKLPINLVGGKLASSSVILPSAKFNDVSFARFGNDSATVLNNRFLRSTSLPGLLFSFFDFNRIAVGITPADSCGSTC